MRALLFTTGSPFARGVRIILDELKLDYERREEITTTSVQQRAQATPTLQVPTFWDGNFTLWESTLIADYLLTTYTNRSSATPPLAESIWRKDTQWQDKLLLSTIQTFGTTVATISQMKTSGVKRDGNMYLTRCVERLPHLMVWLEQQVVSQDEGFFENVVSVQDIFLTCWIRFIENRPLDLDPRLGDHPKIESMCKRLDQRHSFIINPILWWEPGVIGYADDGITPIYDSATRRP